MADGVLLEQHDGTESGIPRNSIIAEGDRAEVGGWERRSMVQPAIMRCICQRV